MSVRRAAVAIGAASILGSCRIDAEGWAEKAARAACDHSKRCDPTGFEYLYADEDSCRTRREAEWRSPDLVGCGFDDAQARLCLDDLRSVCGAAGTADETPDTCLTVWSCGATTEETSDTSVPLL